MSPVAANHVLDGKYRLQRVLDEGGMGCVWEGEHLTLHSPVAIKLLSPAIADDAEGKQRFLREARTAAGLRSPHVVQVLDHGVHEGQPYLVMERLEGESLARRLLRRGRLTLEETESILRQVARAVGKAHEAGVIHRDLKPANIFLCENDDEELVKLLDFGIAKTLGAGRATAPTSNDTRTGTFLGTPPYASPEQTEGAKNIDHRTDVWSMGVIAFECLLGQQPFLRGTLGSTVLAICAQPLPVPSEHGLVPRGFDEWFARACCRDPDARYQTAREAARALRDECVAVPAHAAPVEAAPPAADAEPPRSPASSTTGAASLSTRVGRPRRAAPLRAVALGSAAAAGLAGLLVWLREPLRANRSSEGRPMGSASSSESGALPPQPAPPPSSIRVRLLGPMGAAGTPSAPGSTTDAANLRGPRSAVPERGAAATAPPGGEPPSPGSNPAAPSAARKAAERPRGSSQRARPKATEAGSERSGKAGARAPRTRAPARGSAPRSERDPPPSPGAKASAQPPSRAERPAPVESPPVDLGF